MQVTRDLQPRARDEHSLDWSIFSLRSSIFRAGETVQRVKFLPRKTGRGVSVWVLRHHVKPYTTVIPTLLWKDGTRDHPKTILD